MFDRRYEQFTAIKDFLGSIMRTGKSKPDEQLKYLTRTRGLRFIFDKKISDYVNTEIWHLAIDLECLQDELEGVPRGEERTINVKKQSEIKKKLRDRFELLEEKFSKYLQLDH